ncbi:MAG: DUF2275 domain-containing protein [Syntrophorhabdus sp.]
MSNCRDISQYLDAYIENSLEARDKPIVEDHLVHCPACRALFDQSRQTRAILSQLDEIDPPPWLATKIMAQIVERGEKKGLIARFFYPLRIKIPVQALATALVVVLSIYVYKSTFPELQDVRPPLQTPSRTAGPGVEIKSEAPAKKDDAKQFKQKEHVPMNKNEAQPGTLLGKTPSSRSPDSASGYAKDETIIQAREERPEKSAMNARGSGGVLVPSEPAEASKSSEKKQAFKMRAAPTVEEETPRSAVEHKDSPVDYPASHIALFSDDPVDTSRKAHNILRSLGATSVRESTRNEYIVITGNLNTKFLADLEMKLSNIAIIDKSTIAGSIPGAKEHSVIEISIRKSTGN